MKLTSRETTIGMRLRREGPAEKAREDSVVARRAVVHSLRLTDKTSRGNMTKQDEEPRFGSLTPTWRRYYNRTDIARDERDKTMRIE